MSTNPSEDFVEIKNKTQTPIPTITFPDRVTTPPIEGNTNVTLVKDGRFRTWDAEADKTVLNAHDSGKEVMDIARELNRSGYGVTRAEVVESLFRQGVENIHRGADEIPKFPWDDTARNIAKTLFEGGETVETIVDKLCARGYNTTAKLAKP
ncbi:hypothetical protein MMC31_001229 [Peltigera leucophlebia]|nr:hypothetical protein [Peltigera leucophlebia]